MFWTVWVDQGGIWWVETPADVYQPLDAGSANRMTSHPITVVEASEQVTVRFVDGSTVTLTLSVPRPPECVPELPVTGSELWLAVLAIGVMFIGGGAVLFARRP